jgi:tRNA(Ile)-lysidine synthase
MEQSVRASLARLAPDAHRVLLAVSGGSDSMALLRAVAGAPGLEPVVAHLDHRLRDDAAADAAFVRAVCDRLGVPVVVEEADVGAIAARERRNVEEVGRTLRYAFFARVARAHRCDVVATAHTRNDQAETVLLQLLRGSAHPRGIAPREGRVVRPMLELSKDDLRGWLDRIGQTWREDVGNRDLARDRAWLRREVLPRLERRRPGAVVRLARFGRLQRDQADFLAAEAERRFGTGPLARAALAAAPPALQREALGRLVRSHGGDVDGLHLEALVAALPGRAAVRRDLPGGVRVRMLGDRVDVLPAGADEVVPEAGDAPEDEVVFDRPEALPEGLPASLLEEGPWTLRAPRPGDRIRLRGGTRRVADVLAEAGVPREERAARRLLARDGRVVWIDGIEVADGIDEAAADPDRGWMRRALSLADRAAADGELPVGALLVRDGRVIGEGVNRRERSADPSAHAELEAMRAAAAREGDWRLEGATLYVTLEPCPMCAGAILESRIERVVWGAANLREGAFGSVVDLAAGPWKRVPELRSGVLAREAAWRLKRFFEVRRTGAEGAGADGSEAPERGG